MDVSIPQLPARDRAQSEIGPTTYSEGLIVVSAAAAPSVVEAAPVVLQADQIQAALPPEQFTTGSYRGKAKR